MSNQNEKNIWPGWETVRLIGRGSFGTVYEIQRNILGEVERAALKVISIPQNESDIALLREDGYDEGSITATFENHLRSIVAEYSMMRRMNGCTNIVNCDDVRYIQRDDGIGWTIYIKMELLSPLVKELPEKIPEQAVIQLGKDICRALELCKKHGIIHRDIKPQNIFISSNGDYKLGDFGIAKTVEKTMSGTKIGTYKYMAPEVYHSQPYGGAADIYSLGLVMYWMMNRRRMPFLPQPPAGMHVQMDEEARLRRLNGETLPPPAQGSEALKKIVLKACAYDPEHRYGSATEMLRDLQMLIGTAEVTSQQWMRASMEDLTQEEEKTMGLFRNVQGQTRQSGTDRGRRIEDLEKTVILHPSRDSLPCVPEKQLEQEAYIPVMAGKENREKKASPILWIVIVSAVCIGLVVAFFLRSGPKPEVQIPETTEAAPLPRETEPVPTETEDPCAKGHIWETATFERPQFCAVCGLETGQSKGYPLVLCEQISSTNKSGSDTDVTEGNWKDIHGQTHEDALKFWVANFGDWENEESAVYNVDGRFDTIDLTLVLGEESQRGADAVIRIWADGTLVYQSDTLSAGQSAVQENVSIAGAELLKIACSTSSPVFCHCIARVVLYKEAD